jgi:hypothetical protein
LEGGYYIQPTLFKGHNKMRIFQEEIFGPVLAVTTFKSTEEAIEIANDTLYGLGAGVWTRDAHELYQIPRAIQAGRVWVNQHHGISSWSSIWWLQAIWHWKRKPQNDVGALSSIKKYADFLQEKQTWFLLILKV